MKAKRAMPLGVSKPIFAIAITRVSRVAGLSPTRYGGKRGKRMMVEKGDTLEGAKVKYAQCVPVVTGLPQIS